MPLPSLRRRLPRATVAWFAVAAMCGVLALVSVRDVARRAAIEDRAPTVTVVIAAGDIPAGTLVEADQLTAGPVAAPGPPGALTDPRSVTGALALTSFVEGEPVTSSRLARPAGPLVSRVPPGLLGVPIAVAALPEGLRAGDRVDVLATFTTARPYTTTVATDVAVLGVGAGGGAGPLTDGGDRGLLVLTSPEVARQLVQAAATGSLAIAVRGYEPFEATSGTDG